jgi:hypothetical protein
MGMNDFAPYQKLNTSFIVQNIITDSNKTIKIFNYPIPVGMSRDLLEIPGVGEADIRASLLKGELLIKILAKEIKIIQSDIDLLQFNYAQLLFLQNAGISTGLQVDVSNEKYPYLRQQILTGLLNNSNVVFKIPNGYFLYSGNQIISVYRNGVRLAIGKDYSISESGGPGTGYDTIILSYPPFPTDSIAADYYYSA